MNTVSEYRKNRAAGMDPRNALVAARHHAEPLPYELDTWNPGYGEDRHRTTAGPYSVTVKIEPDYDADISWLGEFTDDPTDAIPRRDPGRGEYKYFRPATTEAEHYRDLREMKYGRTEARELAREYVRRDMKHAADYQAWCIGATVTVEGTEIGYSSLWGIELADDPAEDADYIRNTAAEIIEEALAEARKQHAKLTAVPIPEGV